MTVAVLVAGEGYRMVKARDLGYSDNLDTASNSQNHLNSSKSVLSKRSITNCESFNTEMSNGSYKSGEKGGKKDMNQQQDSVYMNGNGNRDRVRCPKKRFSLSESTNASDLSRKKIKADNSDSGSSTSSLPEDAYEKIELFNKSIPSHVRLRILNQEVKKLKDLEKQEKKKSKRKKKQQEEEEKRRHRQQQRSLNLENNHRPKFEEAFCDSSSSSSSNEDDVLMDNVSSKAAASTNRGDMGPYRRLSMLAAASLLESVNTKSSSNSTKSLEESSDKNDDEEDEEETKDESNSSARRSSPDNSARKRGRRDSTESSDELEELINGMSRRSSMLSTSSSIDGEANGHSSNGDKSNNPNIDNAIVSRRLSLIAAQAASLESRSLTRRASLIAAAEIFESLNREAVSRRRSSIIGTFDKRMSFDRRQSLLAVSQLLTNIENGNEARRTNAMYRRGSDISLGSVFSSLGGDSSEMSPVLPSRRASIEPFGANVTNTSRTDSEGNSKSVLGNANGNVASVTADGISVPKSKDSPGAGRFPKGIDYESFKSLYVSMEKSKASQTAIHDWDRKMGLRRSHSQTMRNSSRSRKKLINVMTLSAKSS